ncbi:MAG: hypothetical protein UT30_C0022G0003 [Candidatus Uhrbacteria bacterium GW2011_GWF2_39_13]|uniref:Uncharacterized protein n=1 Tax=Candidatus Uhrbacteria bacterium GW2011_GWF2_39_13 TaxID=1618995 RepID=A0A0G0PZV3_9BACT|nr:MAG: hypothetical protein UT30_C0022G0003 [Candidatus Uhrbacteria bacterium GW2011_GWF2_39_13]
MKKYGLIRTGQMVTPKRSIIGFFVEDQFQLLKNRKTLDKDL